MSVNYVPPTYTVVLLGELETFEAPADRNMRQVWVGDTRGMVSA